MFKNKTLEIKHWRIEDSPDGCNNPYCKGANLLFRLVLAKTCMNMKNDREGEVPPWIRHSNVSILPVQHTKRCWSEYKFLMKISIYCSSREQVPLTWFIPLLFLPKFLYLLQQRHFWTMVPILQIIFG